VNARFEIFDTPLLDLKLIQRKLLGDHRGYLERLFCKEEFQAILGHKIIAQINHTFTAEQSTIRGMHFQHPPFAETKFISCLRGEVFDVAVDLRASSPTFLKWHAELLTADNQKTLLIPEGFAHGFQTLTKNCEMLYFHTMPYQQNAEDGLHPADPALGITWPMPITEMSSRDSGHLFLNEKNFKGLSI